MTQPATTTSRVNIYHPAEFVENVSVGTSTRSMPFIINEGKKFVTLSSLQGMVANKENMGVTVNKGKKQVTSKKSKK